MLFSYFFPIHFVLFSYLFSGIFQKIPIWNPKGMLKKYFKAMFFFSIFEPLLRGVHAPCSFHNFPPCSLLLSNFGPLLPFHLCPCSFFIFLCCLLPFSSSSCSKIFFAPCSFLECSSAPLAFLVLLAPGVIICLLHAPLPILWLAPCTFVISRHPWSTNRGFSLAAPLFFWFKDDFFPSKRAWLIQEYGQDDHGRPHWVKLPQGEWKVPSILGQIA